MDKNYFGQVTRHAVSEFLMIKNFKMYIVGRANENLTAFGIDALPSMLYILTCGERLDYTVDSVRVTPDFVERIIDGYDANIVAFSYAHRLISYDKNGEEKKQVGIYYEDNLVRITHYHDAIFNILTDSYVIREAPDASIYNEYHPAMVNISNLLSIN